MQLFKKMHIIFCNFIEYNYWLSLYLWQKVISIIYYIQSSLNKK